MSYRQLLSDEFHFHYFDKHCSLTKTFRNSGKEVKFLPSSLRLEKIFYCEIAFTERKCIHAPLIGDRPLLRTWFFYLWTDSNEIRTSYVKLNRYGTFCLREVLMIFDLVFEKRYYDVNRLLTNWGTVFFNK